MVARRLARYADGLQDDGAVAQALGDEQTARLCLELADTVARLERPLNLLAPPVARA